MTKRLWDKGEELNTAMHKFTVGNDPQTDLNLVKWDAIASAAHAKMLESISILSKEECLALLTGLKKIVELNAQNKFTIPQELEDCHTTIESFLSSEIGEAGLKIHTGRSRNDQVLVAMRLYLRDALISQLEEVTLAVETLLLRAKKEINTCMPGYTHFQAAMPTSVGIWFQAFAEALLDLSQEGLELLHRLNCNPLGVASGFCVPLPLNREMTAKLLGFNRVQRNPIDVANSRGRYELKYIRWCADVASVVEKFSCDLILFSTREFGFFSLPTAFTTGSSIMPQKRNPDVVELLRARAGRLRGLEQELLWTISKLPSSYHRDHQYTKEPAIKATCEIQEIVPMFSAVVNAIEIHSEKLNAGLDEEVFATYEVYKEVKNGLAFRDAYRKVGEKIKSTGLNLADLKKEFAQIAKNSNQEITLAESELSQIIKNIVSHKEQFADVCKNVFEK
jgi:argininosuccinate lyase